MEKDTQIYNWLLVNYPKSVYIRKYIN